MSRKLLLAVALAALVTVVAAPIYAGHAKEATVSATVTPGIASVSVAIPGAVPLAYGTVNLGVTDAEPSPQDRASGPVEAFLATTGGNVNSELLIRGGNSTGAVWTLVQAAPASNEYRHKFRAEETSAGVTITLPTTDLTTDNATVFANEVAGTAREFYLALDMPSDVTTGTTQATLPVIVSVTPT